MRCCYAEVAAAQGEEAVLKLMEEGKTRVHNFNVSAVCGGRCCRCLRCVAHPVPAMLAHLGVRIPSAPCVCDAENTPLYMTTHSLDMESHCCGCRVGENPKVRGCPVFVTLEAHGTPAEVMTAEELQGYMQALMDAYNEARRYTQLYGNANGGKQALEKEKASRREVDDGEVVRYAHVGQGKRDLALMYRCGCCRCEGRKPSEYCSKCLTPKYRDCTSRDGPREEVLVKDTILQQMGLA